VPSRTYLERSDLSHWGWSHDWSSHSFSGAWLHECQYNSQHNGEDDQEDIKGWLTLATPSNCEENSQKYTQTSQQHFKVNIHFYYHHRLFLELEVNLNFLSNIF
jgi:hypothetical protein